MGGLYKSPIVEALKVDSEDEDVEENPLWPSYTLFLFYADILA